MLTNLEKVFWPAEQYTKGDLLRYYEAAAPWILPHLKDRPLSLKRFPDGIEGNSFFQKNVKEHPDWIQTAEIEGIHYLLIQNEESLLYAANLACIEIHPFLSRVKKLEFPDYVVFDLDPKGAPFHHVIETARQLRQVLEEIGIESYCKTSGKSGLHIAVPLGAKYTYEQARRFAELIAALLHERLPEITTLERSLSKRKRKVYIDVYQNVFGQTIAAPYAVRASPGAPVSAPLKWSEVKKGLDPAKFTIKTMIRRLKKVGDLYAPVLGKGANIKKAVTNKFSF